MRLRTKKQKLLAALGLCVAALFLLAVIGIAVLQTGAFRAWASRKIITSLQESTGARAQISRFQLGLVPLTADLYGVVVHGSETSQSMPLFRAQHIHVSLQLLPLLHKQAQINEFLIDAPELFVHIDSAGHSNLPAPAHASQGPSSFRAIFHHAQIRDGSLTYNDMTIPVFADIYGLQANLASTLLGGQYRAEIQYEHGRVLAKNFNPIEHGFLLHATFDNSQAKIERLRISLPRSQFEAQGMLDNYQRPQFTGAYRANLSGEELARILKAAAIPSGEMLLEGTLSYAPASTGSPSLQTASSQGTLASEVLTIRQNGTLIPVHQLHGRYALENGQLRITAVEAGLLGGRFVSDTNLFDLNRNSASLEAQLNNLSLLELRRTSRTTRQLPRIASKTNLRFSAHWAGGTQNVVAELHASFSSQQLKRFPDDIPLDGFVALSYNARSSSATLTNLALQTGATQLHANGTLAKNSQVQLHFATSNLQELIALAAANGAADSIANAHLDTLHGAATLDGQVSGTVQAPHLSGQLATTNVSVESSQWQSMHTNVQLNPSLLQLSNAVLQGAPGRIQLSATVPLRDWSLDRSAPLALDAKTQTLSLASIQQLTHTDYPLKGFLNAELHARGSLAQPTGSGHVDFVKGSVYGEALTSFSATFRADDESLHLDTQAQSAAGALQANITYDPPSRRYTLNAHLQNLTPSELTLPQTASTLSSISGSISGDVSGSGSLDDPKLNANLQSTSLQFRGETVSHLRATVTIQNHNAELQITSLVAGTSISVKGKVALAANDPAFLAIDTGSIDLSPLLEAHLSTAGPVSGNLELHATATGPLKTPQQIQAHVEIPTLRLTGKNVTLSNAEPVRLDYSQGVVKVLSAVLTGPATNVSLSGSLPLQSTAAMDLAAKGNLDCKILAGFVQDSLAEGRAQLLVQLRGTLANPDVSGSVQLANVGFSSDSVPIGLESLNGTATLHGKRLQIDKLSGLAGGGKFDLGGTIDLGANPVYALTLSSRSSRVRQNGVRAILDTDLNLSGSATPTLAGSVTVRKLSFDQNSDLNGIIAQLSGDDTVSTPSPIEQKIKLSVAVQSEQEVGLTSSQLSVSGSANLQVVGTVADPVVLGRVSLTGGEVFFLGKRFELQNGTIAFANSTRTRPILNLDVGTTVEQYDVTIHLSGSLDKLKTTYTSEPSLSSADIINLLAFGQTTAESQSRSPASASLGAESAVASAVGGQVAGQIEKISGISQLTIDPLAGNNQNPGAQVAIQQRVTGNLLVTFSTDITSAQTQTVQLKYQVRPNVTVSVLRDENGGYGLDIRFHKSF